MRGRFALTRYYVIKLHGFIELDRHLSVLQTLSFVLPFNFSVFHKFTDTLIYQFFLLLLSFLFSRVQSTLVKMSQPIPGPPGLPILGNISDVDPADSVNSLGHLADTYGKLLFICQCTEAD